VHRSQRREFSGALLGEKLQDREQPIDRSQQADLFNAEADRGSSIFATI
jgi:hypothetical protein